MLKMRDYPESAMPSIRRPERADSLAQRIARQRPLVVLIECLLLAALATLLYLSQVAGADTANSQVQTLQAQSQLLQRQDAALHAQLGQARSPAYIAARARALGYGPPPQFVVQGDQP